MSPSEQFRTSTSPVLHVTLDTFRPNMHGPFSLHRDQPIGVAAWVSNDGSIEPHWMAGYAKSEDMARGYMVLHLLQLHEYQGKVLEVSSAGLKGILGHVVGARERGGLRSGGKPFEAFDVFDPLEAAQGRGEWRLSPPYHGEGLAYRAEVKELAELAMQSTSHLLTEFAQHKRINPYYSMLREGRTADPQSENNRPRLHGAR